jgi:hypothetical protein
MGFTSFVDRHPFDAYPEPTFHFDAAPDPNPTARFTHATKSEKILDFYSQQYRYQFT